MEKNNKIYDYIDKLVLAARDHQTPSPETKDLLAKLDKSLSLLAQEVSFIRTTIADGFIKYDKQIDTVKIELELKLNKNTAEISKLKELRSQIIGGVAVISIVFNALYNYLIKLV